jgi:hypothetical protein
MAVVAAIAISSRRGFIFCTAPVLPESGFRRSRSVEIIRVARARPASVHVEQLSVYHLTGKQKTARGGSEVRSVLILLKLHGELRWLVALGAAVAIVRFAYGWFGRQEYKGLDRGLMAGVTGLLDLNFLFGITLLFLLGVTGSPNRIEHAATMFLALAVLHSSAMWRRSDDAVKKFRNNLIVVLVASSLVVVGVIRLRGGWIF